MEARRFEPFTQFWAWRFLAFGLFETILVALLAIVLSLPLATGLALARLSPSATFRLPAMLLVEGIRALPVLLFIWLIFLTLFRLGTNLDPRWPVVIALGLYTTAINAETIRAGVLSLERGQMEAARALGLTYLQAMRFVILPQTFRRVLPPLIAQFVTLVKDTSLGYIVGLGELTRQAGIIYQGERNPLETLFVVAVIYFVLNYLLGQLAVWLEARLSGQQVSVGLGQ
jgi:His/Glu/Gln/Arg/opine family amino acid ABC transporter permease subunit